MSEPTPAEPNPADPTQPVPPVPPPAAAPPPPPPPPAAPPPAGAEGPAYPPGSYPAQPMGYGPPPGAPPYGRPYGWRWNRRPRWLLPTLTGLIGLVIGGLIGGFGVAAANHNHRSGFGPGYGRVHMVPGPFGNRGPGVRPFPGRPLPAKPTPSPSPS